MRYIKVFLLVLLFFVVMMLFVQNQASFSDAVTLKFDPMFAPAMASAPIPRYALLLICFALGAAVVLLMLMWDRVALSGRASAARRRASSLQKQLDKMTAEKQKLEAALKDAEARVKEAEAKAEAAAQNAAE
ncbi:hypothetical protein [Mailhella sp.]|uniref:hypothetical protein n=1 Tax=Mailhella sp. TaxID=1981029 RepID=UPI003AB1D64B